MKHFNLWTAVAVLSVFSVLMSGCVSEELPDNRDKDYGYAQFKLYKASSYGKVTKAIVPELDLLSSAEKIRVELISSDGQQIAQTLTLTASDAEARALAAEYLNK